MTESTSRRPAYARLLDRAVVSVLGGARSQ